jgi:hypothetical protein
MKRGDRRSSQIPGSVKSKSTNDVQMQGNTNWREFPRSLLIGQLGSEEIRNFRDLTGWCIFFCLYSANHSTEIRRR